MRQYIFYLYLAVFCLNVGCLLIIPDSVWALFEWWEIIILAILPVTIGFSSVLLSYWVFLDGEDICELKEQLDHFQKQMRKT